MKWLRRAGWLMVAWLGLCALLWLVLPWWLKPTIEQQATRALGRLVTVNRVEVMPWSLELRLHQLVVAGLSSSEAPLLSVDEVLIDADVRSLWRRAPVLNQVLIRAPHLQLARTAPGHYDIDDLLQRWLPGQDEATSSPLRFALYNLELRDGRVTFDDRPVQRVQTLDDLKLTVPFLSNLPTQLEVKVEPRLQFRLNGSPFDSGAQATPFAKQRSAVVHLTMASTDLAPYLPYLPAALPVKPAAAHLGADLALHLQWLEKGAPQVSLRGELRSSEVQLVDTQGQALVAWSRAIVQLSDVQPLQRDLRMGSLSVEGLQVWTQRNRSGRWNWAWVMDHSSPSPESPPLVTGVVAKPAAPWQWSVKAIELRDSRVSLDDSAVRPAASLQLQLPAVNVGPLRWPEPEAVPFKLSMTLHPGASGRVPEDALASLTVQGQASLRQAQAQLTLQDGNTDSLAPYLAQVLGPELHGKLSAQAQLHWQAAEGMTPPHWRISEGRLSLDDWRLLPAAPTQRVARSGKTDGPRAALAAMKSLQLDGFSLDSSTRHISAGQVTLLQPQLLLQRSAQGEWSPQGWWIASKASASPEERPSAPLQASSEVSASDLGPGRPPSPNEMPPWQWRLGRVQVQGGELAWQDARTRHPRPVAWLLQDLQLMAQEVAVQDGRTLNPMKLQWSGRLKDPHAVVEATPRNAPSTGRFSGQGQLGLQPLAARLSLQTERLPLHLLAVYGGDPLALDVQRAELGLKTELELSDSAAGLDLNAQAQLALADVEIYSRSAPLKPGEEREARATADPLMQWQRLAVDGLRLSMKPGRPLEVDVGQAQLEGLQTRLIVTEQGHFNLRDVTASASDAATEAGGPKTGGRVDSGVARAVARASDAASSATTPPAPSLRLSVGGVRVVNASIDFTDRFVKPNYSAQLTELHGSLGAFRSDSRQMAALMLKGKAAGTASLEIAGQINPMAQPLALDIQAKATDLELAPLSPYAAKYAGYAIERGKLSMSVSYQIDAQGKLEAKNQLVLNQLTFGDKVDSPNATQLPVLLAVALLKDRHGVIDINLPISGSLQDPQFSVGGLVVKVIVNLIGKALTAPFSLLFGGGH